MSARYSKQTGYTVARRSASTRRSTRTVQRRVKFGPTAAKYFGLAILAVLALITLTSSSSSSTTAYEQTDLRQQSSQVEKDIEQLKLEAKRAQSLQAVQNSSVKEGMEPVKDAGFVESGEVAGATTQQ